MKIPSAEVFIAQLQLARHRAEEGKKEDKKEERSQSQRTRRLYSSKEGDLEANWTQEPFETRPAARFLSFACF